jgi:hypothetical protein
VSISSTLVLLFGVLLLILVPINLLRATILWQDATAGNKDELMDAPIVRKAVSSRG